MKYNYICLCGNSILANRKDLKISCNAGHGGSVKMLCKEQFEGRPMFPVDEGINMILRSWNNS